MIWEEHKITSDKYWLYDNWRRVKQYSKSFVFIKKIKDFFDTKWEVIIIEENWKIYSAFKTNWWRILWKHEITDDMMNKWAWFDISIK